MELTQDQLTTLIEGSVEKAIKAINPPDPAQIPGQSTKTASNVNLRRYNPFPSFKSSVLAAKNGTFKSRDAFERDFVQAAAESFGWVKPDEDEDDDDAPRTKAVGSRIVWPKTLDEARQVLAYMGEKDAAKSVERIDNAIKSIDAKAMTESVTSTFTAGSAGGFLVPPQFLQSLFQYALAPRVALRNTPGIGVIPVSGVTINLPRESTRAGASEQTEAGSLSTQDATLSEQTITIKKQYAYRRWSNELAGDSEPAFAAFLSQTLGRDLAIEQDSQYLTGSGSGANITGILNYSSLTTGPSLGTNGRTVKNDDVIDAIYLLEAQNADANFFICHPRTINSLRKEKDNEGRYLVSTQPVAWTGESQQVSTPRKVLAGYIPVSTSTTLSIAQTVGGSTDCSTAIVGDSSQVFILERQGAEIMFSEHIYFTTDELAVRVTARSAVAILQPSAVLLVTGIRA